MKRMIAAAFLAIGLTAGAQNSLWEGFQDTPREFRPRVWWHWMNGNITKDGIEKDLLWMDRAGIVGFHNFDAGLATPQLVERRLPYMTEEWKDAFNHALDIADSLGMEVTVASSPGWSVTGGPWVSKDDAMKKLVWSEATLERKKAGKVKMDLPEPLMVCGPYQDIPRYADNIHRFDYYQDVAVVAVRLKEEDVKLTPSVTVSGCAQDIAMLSDGLFADICKITPDASGTAWIQYEFKEPQTVKCLLIGMGSPENGNYRRRLEYSEDGVHFKSLLYPFPDSNSSVKYTDVPETRARYFRISSAVPGQSLDYTELELIPVHRVNIHSEKSGYFVSGSIRDFFPTPHSDDVTAQSDVIDITDCCHDGVLTWKAPAGRWKIYRFGYNLTGKENYPASPEATGLEVDKFDAEAVKRYYRDYIDYCSSASKGRFGSVISHLMIDSFEAQCQTWTPRMPEEFLARRGYSLIPWLPALAGQIIGSSEDTERFLFDWRQTLSELMVENHYDIVNEILAPYGMKRHTESHESGRAYVVDGMDVKRHADIPMSAFWIRGTDYSSYPRTEGDVRESASVSHIYGQNICAAESFTADGGPGNAPKRAWIHHPGSLKPAADAAMASGLNRFIIHSSVHQPSDDVFPGVSLGHYGQWFNRHETWSEEAGVWLDYLSRSSYLLQQGRFVADVAYYYGETTNITARFKISRAYVPSGMAYDFVNRSALLDVLRVEGDRLVTDSGMSYGILMVDNEAYYMSVPVLRKIDEIAKAGILVIGNEPVMRSDLMGSEEEYRALVNSIWHSGRKNVMAFPEVEMDREMDGFRSGTDRKTVVDGLSEVALGHGLQPDVRILSDQVTADAGPRGVEFGGDPGVGSFDGTEDIRFVHRRLGDGDIYWIANITPYYRTMEVSLRACGKVPQIWHAETGVREAASYRVDGDRTVVRLEMTPDDAQFIMMCELPQAPETSGVRNRPAVAGGTVLEGPWTVAFQPGRGAPAEACFTELQSWTESSDEGVRYFSGSAVYTSTFIVSETGRETWLDLGDVRNMARVKVNGHDLGLLWKVPYRVEISDALVSGENVLEVTVTNSWVNRLVGDAKLPEGAAKLTTTSYQHYKAEDEPLPAGLIGPVRLLAE